MKELRFLLTTGLATILAAGVAYAQPAQAPAGIPRQLLVTVEAKHGKEIPDVPKESVLVYEGHDRDTVTDWIPMQGEQAALELFILLDDDSGTNLGAQLQELQKFIVAQPPTAKVGVAYMQNGTARIAQELTTEHELAAKSLRLPLGSAGVDSSPYFSISDLIKRWPASSARREVLVISAGIDRYYGAGDPNDPYLDAAITDANRAGIVISAIYNPDAGHFGHSHYQTFWGQNYLSELADKTGGEAYYIGLTGTPVSFAPYLDDLARRLQHQYLLKFLAKVPKRSGWQKVRLSSEVPNVDLVSAGRVYVSLEP